MPLRAFAFIKGESGGNFNHTTRVTFSRLQYQLNALSWATLINDMSDCKVVSWGFTEQNFNDPFPSKLVGGNVDYIGKVLFKDVGTNHVFMQSFPGIKIQNIISTPSGSRIDPAIVTLLGQQLSNLSGADIEGLYGYPVIAKVNY